jgi:hypothetical protein
MRGISTIPAPRRPRLLPFVDEPVRDVRTDAVRADPAAEGLAAVAAETACDAAGASGAGAVPQTSQ